MARVPTGSRVLLAGGQPIPASFESGDHLCPHVLERLSERTKPVTLKTIPEMSNHMDLSVGVPWKNRDTSELKESDALIPKTASTMPAARSAIPSALFMMCLSFF
jgi:hypothetical protein